MSAEPDYKLLYEQSQAQVSSLQLQMLGLSQQLAQLQKMIFGSRQERFVPEDPGHPQLALDLAAIIVKSFACFPLALFV